MTRLSILSYFPILLFLGVLSCVDTMDLPTQTTDGYTVIGQDEEKYIEITPVWDEASLGFSSFTDMFCADDGRFFLTDSSSASIHVIRAHGLPETDGYDALSNIQVNGQTVKPLAVCVDKRFNVFFTDGGDKVYNWNQFLANADIDALVDSITVTINGVRSRITPYDLNFIAAGGDVEIDIFDNVLQTNADSINAIRQPQVFFDPSSPINAQLNPSYSRIAKSFVSVAPPGSGAQDLYMYVNDSRNNYIIKVNFIIEGMVKLHNGQYLFHYKGIWGGNAASPGTGAGTVSSVTGMCSDDSGNLLYTQLGDFFGLHKVRAGTFSSVFTLGTHEIMDLNMFESPMDVAVDGSGNIFVLDSALNEVKKFDSNGAFLKDIAISETWIKEGDSLVLVTENNVMKRPSVMAFYDDVLYIGDTGNNRILRYTKVDDVNIDLPVN